jgi:hypothetical protein
MGVLKEAEAGVKTEERMDQVSGELVPCPKRNGAIVGMGQGPPP